MKSLPTRKPGRKAEAAPGTSRAKTKPAARPTPEPIGFDEYLANVVRDHPEFGARLLSATPADRERETARKRRQYGYRSCPLYRDAHAIYDLAKRLRKRMAAFADDYDGTEGEEALKAAGAVPPGRGDPDECHTPANAFAAVVEAITGHAFNVCGLVGSLDEVTATPVPLKGGAA